MADDLLAEFARTRDVALRDELVVRNLPLVKFVARKMSANLPGNVDLDDLVSWGSFGLLDAIEKFDPSRGAQFSTYAVTRIRGDILDGLQKMDWAPKQVTSKVRAVRRAREALTTEHGRSPTVDEMAAHMDCTSAEVRGWMVDDTTTRLKPLKRPDDDSPAGGLDNDSYLAEDAAQEVAGEVVEIRSRMTAAVASLPPREAQVLVLYYRDKMTLREIAAALGVSVSSATQTHTRMIELVKDRLATFGAVA